MRLQNDLISWSYVQSVTAGIFLAYPEASRVVKQWHGEKHAKRLLAENTIGLTVPVLSNLNDVQVN